MSKNKLIAAALATLTSVSILAAVPAPVPVAAMSPTSVAAAPCGPILTAPDPADPTSTKPAAPTNVKIVSGDEVEGELPLEESESGPYVETDSAGGAIAAAPQAYFDMLAARADCLVAYSLRSQTQLDSIETRSVGPKAYPVVYDSAMDAALFRIDPSAPDGSGGGSTDSQQKRPRIDINHTSMLLTWDLRFDEGFAFKGDTYLRQHKTYKLTYGDNLWITLKTNYASGANSGQGVAQLFVASQAKTWLGPGTTNYSSEILEPRLAQFFIKANTWTRYWILVEGNLGGGEGGSVVYLSCWAADETRDPIQLYDRIAMYTPVDGLTKFWFEYDASQEGGGLTNGMMKSWNRNLVVLKGVTLADAKSLLQRPVN